MRVHTLFVSAKKRKLIHDPEKNLNPPYKPNQFIASTKVFFFENIAEKFVHDFLIMLRCTDRYIYKK